jgi:5'-deoxynucleotidase YfbR-like HD superfamily hydrolase
MAADRAGAPPRAWQRMLSGRRLDLLDPSPLDIEISDIAHGLARVARWNGQTFGDHAFSVAQHSLLVETIFCVQQPEASPDQRMATLLHDAPEYVIGDMISPFKAVVGGDYKAVEQRLQHAIHLRFALPPKLDDRTRAAIKRADQVAAYFEATVLAGFATTEAARYFGRPNGISADRLDLACKPAKAAQAAFARRFAAIEKERAARAAKAGRASLEAG